MSCIRPSDQTALAKFAEIAARRMFDQIDRKFQQAHFPGVIDTLDDCAERFICALDPAFSTIDYCFDRIAERLLANIGFAELKAVTEHRDVPGVLAQLIRVTLRFFSESFQQQPGIMFWCKDLRAFRVNFSIANPDLIDAIHQLRDEIKIEAGAAEGRDLSLGSNDHMGVFNGVIEIISGHDGAN
jgi:hypothetical protein